MWLCELVDVITKLKKEKGGNIVLKSVRPAFDGIVFETTYETYIKWYRVDGRFEEHYKK